MSEIKALTSLNRLDMFGVVECCLKLEDDKSLVEMEGYDLLIEEGIYEKRRSAARVVVYIKSNLAYQQLQVQNHDLIPEVWLKAGHKGKKRSTYAFIYREWRRWKIPRPGQGLPDHEGSRQAQHQRLKDWLEARDTLIQTRNETHILGDINIEGREGKERDEALYSLLKEHLVENGYAQMITTATRYASQSDSCIDHIWSNTTEKLEEVGVLECAASDHFPIYLVRKLKVKIDRVRQAEKRMWSKFDEKDLARHCSETNWRFEGLITGDKLELNERVDHLQEKMKRCIDKVAPMTVKNLEHRRPSWLTPELCTIRRIRDEQRAKARATGEKCDWEQARKTRNTVNRLMKKAAKTHLKKDLDNWGANSKNGWAAVSEHLGWSKPCAPIKLVENGQMITEPTEVAEAMQSQYAAKEKEVEEAVGPPRFDYLTPVRLATAGNARQFEYKELSEKEVAVKIAKVPNKESFGDDEISYGVLKRLSKWIVPELTRIYNMSLKLSTFPEAWKIGRVKPLYKGSPSERTAPKSYRPVCLLSAASRVLEGLLAEQMDRYSEQTGINHKSIHGYRTGMGTNTAILEFQEDLLWAVEEGLLLGLALLDVSAGFDSVPVINLLRKHQVGFGYGSKTLKWLASYLEERKTYVSVEAKKSRSREMTKGIPQGGPLCPALWRGYLAELPEAGKVWWGKLLKVVTENKVEARDVPVPEEGQECVLSLMVDRKPEDLLTQEEIFDQKMRREGTWRIPTWNTERGGMGPDMWRQKSVEDPADMKMTLFADDSANRVTARTRVELERRIMRGLERVFTSMKASRLKVNADKTTYMVIAGSGRRGREDLESTICVQGEVIKAVQVGKCLGLLINNNLTWSEQTQKVITSCRSRMNALYRITELLSIGERKIKAESVIMSKLRYCLESTSTGRKKDLEALQGVQSQAARWVLGKGRHGWSLTAGLKQLSWLSMAQLVCYSSVRTALKVLQKKEPEILYERLTKIKVINRKRKAQDIEQNIQEERVLIRRSWEDLEKLKASTRRAWSVRSLRWLEKIPSPIKELDVGTEASKKELKMWVRRHIHVRGDRIIWGRPLERDHDQSMRETEDRDIDDEDGETEETGREPQGRVEPIQEEGTSEPRRNGVEMESGDESQEVLRACKPLPPLGSVGRTALTQGEVKRQCQTQATTGDRRGENLNKFNTNSNCLMSGGWTRGWGLTELVKPAVAGTEEEASEQKVCAASSCKPLPPLGPVVWTAHTKGEVEGSSRGQANTGDKGHISIGNNNDFCMKWRKSLQKKRYKTYKHKVTKRSCTKRRRRAWVSSEQIKKQNKKWTERDLARESRSRKGIG